VYSKLCHRVVVLFTWNRFTVNKLTFRVIQKFPCPLKPSHTSRPQAYKRHIPYVVKGDDIRYASFIRFRMHTHTLPHRHTVCTCLFYTRPHAYAYATASSCYFAGRKEKRRGKVGKYTGHAPACLPCAFLTLPPAVRKRTVWLKSVLSITQLLQVRGRMSRMWLN
jgi:hypothetical protein